MPKSRAAAMGMPDKGWRSRSILLSSRGIVRFKPSATFGAVEHHLMGGAHAILKQTGARRPVAGLAPCARLPCFSEVPCLPGR